MLETIVSSLLARLTQKSQDKPLDSTVRNEPDGQYNRPTFEESQAVLNEIYAVVHGMDTSAIHAYINGQLPVYLTAIAEMSAPLHSIPKLYWIARAIQVEINEREDQAFMKDKSQEQMNQELIALLEDIQANSQAPNTSRSLTAADTPVMHKVHVAQGLTYAIALREGLFGPNQDGLVPDIVSSLANNEENIFNSIISAADWLSISPHMYGAQTRPIYEGIVARLNQSNPSLLPTPKYPPFPGKDVK